MLKNDTKDQFPLFELPVPDKSEAQPVGKKAEQAAAEGTKAAAVVRGKAKKASAPKPTGYKNREKPQKTAPKGDRNPKSSPGPIPEGDVRLTANIREDLHLKLKIIAATRRTTIGELIEDLVEHHL
jgi:hypothetical protein